MTDKVIVITAPDDVLLDGIRLLLVNLTQEQGKYISDALMAFQNSNIVITYAWNKESISWLLDKKSKSDLIIFNADTDSDALNGYLAAHPNSHYFGTLKDLHMVNDRAIYSVENILTSLENISKNYD